MVTVADGVLWAAHRIDMHPPVMHPPVVVGQRPQFQLPAARPTQGPVDHSHTVMLDPPPDYRSQHQES